LPGNPAARPSNSSDASTCYSYCDAVHCVVTNPSSPPLPQSPSFIITNPQCSKQTYTPPGILTGSPVSTKTILALGDSISAGYYPCKLQSKTPGSSFVGPMEDVYCRPLRHTGYTGYTAGQVNFNSPDWLPYIPTGPNVTILIHLGTNDVYNGIPRNTTITQIQEIVGKIKNKNPQAKIVVAKIIPSRDNDMSSLNNLITPPAFPGATIINAGTGFDPNIHTSDGVHPTSQGGEIIANNFLPAL